MNHTAVITDFIEFGASLKANWIPGIAKSSSPIISSVNCGSCHTTDIAFVSDFWKVMFIIIRYNYKFNEEYRLKKSSK